MHPLLGYTDKVIRSVVEVRLQAIVVPNFDTTYVAMDSHCHFHSHYIVVILDDK